MGGLTALASTAIQALSVANSVINTVGSYQDRTGKRQYDQLKAQSDLSLRNAAEQAALQKEQIRLSAEQTETNRRAALRRAMARQRAQFGASGVGSNGGSSQAVLLGLFDESEEELNQRTALDALKTAAVDQGFAQQQRINTLQLTQLRERDKLKNLSGTLTSLKDLGSILT
jgi:hypothetical protein